MMRRDEEEFYRALRATGRGVFADVVADNIDVPWDRACCLLARWVELGWWMPGVSLRAGWFTDSAPVELMP